MTLLAAGGISEPGIAREIGICQNTLRKHFGAELLAAHERAKAVNLKRLDKAADGGNVTAQKYLDTKFDLAAAARSFEAPAPTQPKRGKKEIAQADAETAGEGTAWGNDLVAPTTRPN